MKKLTIILGMITICLMLTLEGKAETKTKKGILYKYKIYERFDLGNLEIKGEIIAPGDLSILERKRKVFNLELLNRKEFDGKTIQDIIFLR
ncbi:MAG: hypothetical protein KAG61_10365 [Bacteriovoracaceae bacterium]|nr:hypothetical protein [Bacteriovoracaceae bacterium]